MKVGICAIIKDCFPHHLNEWIEWHRLIGVDYFFIYDNESKTPIEESITNSEGVTVIRIEGKIVQLKAYNNCLRRQNTKELPKCDWIAFIDDDEFIVVADGPIKPFLQNQKGSGVGLNWVVFGADGDVASLEPQIKRFVKHIPLSNEVNKHIKSIVRPRFTNSFVNPHFAKYEQGTCLDVKGKLVTGAHVRTATNDVAWINHYYCKSLEEFKTKIAKGRVDSPEAYDLSMYDSVNNNSTETSTKIQTIQKKLTAVTEKRKPIALITPTGGRPDQIKHCMDFMKSQTYTGPVIWILIDDCLPNTVNLVPDDFREDWTVIKLFPTPVWKDGDNTQVRNLKAGIEEVKKHDVEAVFIIEDDDYYTPKYLSVMTAALKGFDVVGEVQTVYYNVQLKSEHRCFNKKHSSLFQTAFTPKMIDLFEEVLNYQVMYLDISFFKVAKNIQFLKGLNLSVGIKGLPGRGGIGNGHNSDMYRGKHEKALPDSLRNSIKETYKI